MRQAGNDGRLSIGQLASISQISVKTLRYYDEEDIFKPAHIDEQSRYRYYSPAQVEQARMLQNLRFAQVPLEDLREFMRDPTPEHQTRLFNRHIERLRTEVHHLNRGIRSLARRRDY
ncbi:MerR family transcriptional regulator (plasmid) [Deinococcus taeanensis]|uniref:MerR family transcriptional regulator n=1 Tax=Deinococcus taeanensis TaxID=2737050 RepID=UPI001CDD4C49|nr:MerR family transcriptional regulator [Deinococcus taeanensis]UBV45229.1 MerR family transcriptional regulator [Deinococcus taeanensis]